LAEAGNLSTDTKHLAYIDALRGYAILGVIGVHASQSGAELAWPLQLLADQGARGVQLFFVVSALTLMLSAILQSAQPLAKARDGRLDDPRRRLDELTLTMPRARLASWNVLVALIQSPRQRGRAVSPPHRGRAPWRS
jgi:hypothetical protein